MIFLVVYAIGAFLAYLNAWRIWTKEFDRPADSIEGITAVFFSFCCALVWPLWLVAYFMWRAMDKLFYGSRS